MQTAKDYLHVFLDMGDALLNSGAEIFRVEDTLNRIALSVFSILISMFPVLLFPTDFINRRLSTAYAKSSVDNPPVSLV